jgi:hypothetical protein
MLRFYELAFEPAPKLSFLTVCKSEVVTNALYADIAQELGRPLERGDVLPLAMTTWWSMCGLATFELSSDLFASLLATDCRGLLMGDIRFPHSAFAVKLPFNLQFLDADNKPMNVHTIIASCVQRSELNLPAIYGFTAFGVSPGDYGTHWSNLANAHDATDVATWVGRPDRDDAHTQSRRTLFNFIFNLCLYCSTNPTQLKVRERGTRSPITKLMKPTLWTVGCPVSLSAAVRSAMQSGGGNPSHRQTWRVSKRFIVRGHWRRQAHGVSRTERKLIWISPFWKGEDRDETIKRIYRMAGT